MPPPLYITTSWDDGHPADVRLAEMLARHGLRGTFYVPRAIDSGVMSPAQLRDVAAKFEIGAHTLNHVFLTDAPDATARQEIEGSKKWVEDQTGRACPMFCPPAGRFNSIHWRMFGAAGFRGARTVEFMSLAAPRPREGLLEMPTTMQAFPHPAKNYWKNLIKRVAAANLATYLLHGRAADWTASARRMLDRARQTGGVFHLWGHSWEIEQAGLWPQLEQVLAMLGAASGAATDGAAPAARVECLTNGEVCERFAAVDAVGAR
jgi:peptidoglycan/xylan/chitin deacetylase (PgdA/CDA1 family)